MQAEIKADSTPKDLKGELTAQRDAENVTHWPLACPQNNKDYRDFLMWK